MNRRSAFWRLPEILGAVAMLPLLGGCAVAMAPAMMSASAGVAVTEVAVSGGAVATAVEMSGGNRSKPGIDDKKTTPEQSPELNAPLSAPVVTSLGHAPSVDGKFNFGSYFALVIGNDNYRLVTPLKTAVNDARMVADLLAKEYGFKVTLLLDATRDQMLDAFDAYRSTLHEGDNLLVYYAGHGYLDAESDRGFWLPVDADANRRANWLSNSDVADFVRATQAKRVLVVADSCYAGTLTRNISVQMVSSDYLSRLARKRARTALVSGGLEPVEDSSGGGHSVFAKAFQDTLMANTGIVDMSEIFPLMRRQVVLNAQQTPQYGDIRQTGHEGGDFIFVRSN